MVLRPPNPHELHLDLRAISERIRPDWEIDTPEMRMAYEHREAHRFFPYGRPAKDVLARMNNALDYFSQR